MLQTTSSRPRSVSQAGSSKKNHKFTTKWKLRSGNQSVLDCQSGREHQKDINKIGSVPERKTRSYLFPNSCSTKEDFCKTS